MPPPILLILVPLLASLPLHAQPKPGQVYAKDGSGIFGYRDTPVQPWSGYHVHDPDRPAPPIVQAPTEAQPPSDAIVLFDGSDLSQFQPSKWKVVDGYIEVTEGSLISKREFGDMQLHVEWATPNPPRGEVMNRGNSGVNLMGIFEIQIWDSYTIHQSPDSQAAAIYGQTPPLVNVTRPPGEWQSYDFVFIAAKFDGDELVERPRVTLFHNGVLVHHNQEIYGGVRHRRLPRPFEPGKPESPLRSGAERPGWRSAASNR